MEPLANQEGQLNTLGQGFVENPIAIVDEQFGIKEYQRDRTFEIDSAEVEQMRQIADDKVALGREQLAIKIAVDEYILAVRVYDAKIKALLMTAREYAAAVERELLEADKAKAGLAVQEEILHRDEVNAKVFLQIVERAMVEADIAKAQVDVAKAQVRAVMADIEAGKAEIALIKAQIEEAMAQAEKAQLQAEVARIYAEILTKQLTTIKLSVGQAEISAGFSYIAARLGAFSAVMDAKIATERVRTQSVLQQIGVVAQVLAAEEATEDLRLKQIQNEVNIFNYEVDITEGYIAQDKELQEALAKARMGVADARANLEIQRAEAHTWVQILENAARQWMYKNMVRLMAETKKITQYISGA